MMKRLRNMLVFALIVLAQHAQARFCQANFTFAFSSSQNEVEFTNTSLGNFTSVEWDFGDGSFSTQSNPLNHVYQVAGTYTVCLIISATFNCNDTICKIVTVQNHGGACIDSSLIDVNHPCLGTSPVCGCNGVTYSNACEAKYRGGITNWTQGPCHGFGNCNASFNYTVFVGIAGYTVLFNNTSTGNFNSSAWDFGDGGTSSQKNPSHTYPANMFPSVVEVCLTVGDSALQCTDSYCQFINLAPIGCFDAAAISPNFACPAVFAPVCGCDGNTYSNACEAYNYHGITSWTNGPCPSNVGCRAGFTTNSHGLSYHFDNTSTGQYTTCSWNFGDGMSSNDCNPDHNFQQPGRYLVCLEISNPNQSCRDSVCIPITVSAPNQSCEDSTLASNIPCPTVYEPVCGCNGITYSNECVASHYDGISNWTRGPCPSSNSAACRSFFSFHVTPTPIGYEVSFSNQSAGNVNVSRWSFGDGTISSLSHPVHTYLVPGYYLVCLTVEDTMRNCSDTYCANIRVNAGNSCMDYTVIDSLVSCPSIIDPVCGCDGKTYINSCEAYYINGITYWTRGTCSNGGCQAGYDFEIDSTGRGAKFNNTSIGNLSHTFWDFGDGSTSSEHHPFHLYEVDGPQIFTACLSIFDSLSNCTDSYCRNISVTRLDYTGIFFQNSRLFEVKVYPNPFGHQTSIEFELRDPAFIKAEIFSFIGNRIALLDDGNATAGRHHFTWNAEEASTGLYFFTLTVNGKKYNHRLLVIR